MQRKHLTTTTAGMAIFGLLLVFVMFSYSLKPSERAKSLRPSIRVNVNPGEFIYIADPTAIDTLPSQLLVFRKTSGELRVIRLPLLNGVRALPDKHWWRPGAPCDKLEPNFKASTIECNEEPFLSQRHNGYRWNLDGKHLAPDFGFDDMLVIEGAEENNEFVFTKGR
jgi:hypothetical protein